MLTNFKNQVEGKFGSTIDNCELLKAISKAKDDVVANRLVFGEDVTAEYFETVVALCIKIGRKEDSRLISRR